MVATRNKPSPELLDYLATALGPHLDKGLHLAVGFSGGRDSVCLLHCLHRLRASFNFQLSALHVHHGLSAQADHWAAQTAFFCKTLAIPFELRRVNVDLGQGKGIEGAARAARYQAFADLSADILLLAQHQGDQAETVLLNLLRGTGVIGAAAMPFERPFGPQNLKLRLIRPFLELSRAAIDAYIDWQQLPFIDDDSNADTSIRRNFLRLEIFPLLRQRFPQAEQQLSHAARHFAEAVSLLDEMADQDLSLPLKNNGLQASALSHLPWARRRNALRRWLAIQGAAPPSLELTDEILRQIASQRGDVNTRISLGLLEIRVWRGEITLLTKKNPSSEVTRFWQGEAELNWAGGVLSFSKRTGQGISLAKIAALKLCERQGGELIRLAQGEYRKKVKHLLQAVGVPPWERARLPFFWSGESLVFVPRLGVAFEFCAKEDEPSLYIEWHP